ncbi:hypothetical protein RMATCC62417_18869 [Rhizopus microsporus]|nr:hypothetical protein RMATCC62417_18869 [Rhizopus microsporus]
MVTIKDDPFVTYDRLRLELHRVDIKVCRQTIISSLKKIEFDSYLHAYKPALTEEHMKKRLYWAREHIHWTDEQWSNVIWDDNSRFTVTITDSGARVIREIDEQYDTKHIAPEKKYSDGEAMI